jgi:hypothetical protein
MADDLYADPAIDRNSYFDVSPAPAELIGEQHSLMVRNPAYQGGRIHDGSMNDESGSNNLTPNPLYSSAFNSVCEDRQEKVFLSSIVTTLARQQKQLVRMQRVLLLVVLVSLGLMGVVIATRTNSASPTVSASSAAVQPPDERITQTTTAIADLDRRLTAMWNATLELMEASDRRAAMRVENQTKLFSSTFNQSLVTIRQAMQHDVDSLQARLALMETVLESGTSAAALLYAVDQIKQAFNILDASIRETRTELDLPEQPATLVNVPLALCPCWCDSCLILECLFGRPVWSLDAMLRTMWGWLPKQDT